MAIIWCNFARADDTGDGSSWATAKKTLQAAITAAGSGGTVYLADNNAETAASSQTLTLPTAEPGVYVISSDVSDAGAIPAYKAGAAPQFEVTGANNDLSFSGAGVFVGVWFKTTDDINPAPDSDSVLKFDRCVLSLSYNASGNFVLAGTDGAIEITNSSIVLNDTGTTSAPVFSVTGSEVMLTLRNLTVTEAGASGRRQAAFAALGDTAVFTLDNVNLSALTGLTTIVSRDANNRNHIAMDGVAPPSGVALISAAANFDHQGAICARCDGNNFGIYHVNYFGSTIDVTDPVRDNGASDGVQYAWKIVTTAYVSKPMPYFTPWVNFWVTANDTRTFTTYIGNATADLTDTEVWLEVEYLGTTSSTVPSVTTDRRADLLQTGTAQTDDTTSDWDADLTYMQQLKAPASGTVDVNKTGMCRARLGVAKAEATLYWDPLITVGTS